MRFEEFESIVQGEPGLEGAIQRAAAAGQQAGKGNGEKFGVVTAAAGMAGLVLIFPIVKRVVYRIGLPWLATVERYSELWRFEAEKWIDGEYVKRGVDPSVVQAASDALLNELERTMESASRDAWERLMEIMSKDEG